MATKSQQEVRKPQDKRPNAFYGTQGKLELVSWYLYGQGREVEDFANKRTPRLLLSLIAPYRPENL